jgi:hypothetical protein
VIPENREKAGTVDRLHHPSDGSESLGLLALLSPDVQNLVWTGRVLPVFAAVVPTLKVRKRFLRPRRTEMGLTIGIVLIILGFTQLHRTLSEPRSTR